MSKDMGPFKDMDPALVRAISAYGTPPFRQIVRVTVRDIGHHAFDALPDRIDTWISWLQDARDETPEEYRDALQCVLSWEPRFYDSGDSASLAIWYERPETDEEMKERVSRGIAYVQEKENSERATYERLRKRYENP